jgi:predicted amidophosphoribosyltransferase
MVNYNPRRIMGLWKSGYALDQHTLSSTMIGHDEFGHPRFETTRSEVGELLYKLKYSGDIGCVGGIVDAITSHLDRWKPDVQVLVPVPPSSARSVQPVILIAKEVCRRTGIILCECVSRKRDETQLKDVFDMDERLRRLEGLFGVDPPMVSGRGVLLFDDLYRSGATMSAIAEELATAGASSVYALAVTRTRSNQ